MHVIATYRKLLPEELLETGDLKWAKQRSGPFNPGDTSSTIWKTGDNVRAGAKCAIGLFFTPQTYSPDYERCGITKLFINFRDQMVGIFGDPSDSNGVSIGFLEQLQQCHDHAVRQNDENGFTNSVKGYLTAFASNYALTIPEATPKKKKGKV